MAVDILRQLADYAEVRVRKKKESISEEEMIKLGRAHAKPKRFPFERSLKAPEMTFICECKKASPSKGLICDPFPYMDIAADYAEGGADAISVLTEPRWFLGHDAFLQEISSAYDIPVLRKDFIVDPYMIYEAAFLGASIVLLITAILSDEELSSMIRIADDLGLSALVETHDTDEIARAVKAGARIIGVNNRNLHDFSVDIHNSIRLRACVPDHILMVAESGIQTRSDIQELERGHVNGVLIGETLMRAENRVQLLKELKGETL